MGSRRLSLPFKLSVALMFVAATVSPAHGQSFTEGRVTLNGLELHYFDWGNVGKPAMLLIPGLGGGGGSARTWMPFADAVRSSFRVMALEPRGCGDSDWAKEYSWDLAVADIDAFVDRFRLSPVLVVGHSSGATWALLYASRHADKVAGVIAVEPGVRAPGNVPPAPTFKSHDEAFEFAKSRWRTHSSVDSAVKDWIVHGLRQTGTERWEWRNDPAVRYRGFPTPDEWLAQLRQVTSRTLYVRGADSQLVSQATAERDTRFMQNAQVVVVSDAGHVTHLANPDGFLRAVCEFLALPSCVVR